MICGVYLARGGGRPNCNGPFVGDVSWPYSHWFAFCETNPRLSVEPVLAGLWMTGNELLDCDVWADDYVYINVPGYVWFSLSHKPLIASPMPIHSSEWVRHNLDCRILTNDLARSLLIDLYGKPR